MSKSLKEKCIALDRSAVRARERGKKLSENFWKKFGETHAKFRVEQRR